MKLNYQHIKKRIILKTFCKLRVLKYWLLSSCKTVTGNAIKNTPVLMNGAGNIYFGKNVHLGYPDSPHFFNSYIYLEARNATSQIHMEDGVHINNNACIISEGNKGIFIGANTIAGPSLIIYDSDFHDLDPALRISGISNTAGVEIGKNVFIGSQVTILKGVKIGNNAVIGSGSVVTKSISANAIAAGNPCKVIRFFKE